LSGRGGIDRDVSDSRHRDHRPDAERHCLGQGRLAAGGSGTIGDGGEVVVVGSLVLDLFRGASASCGIIDLETPELSADDHLPADIGAGMIINPEIHEVLLVSTDGSLVAGQFGAGAPESTTGAGLTGLPVRCSTGD
jgi:hypothetical protein